MANINGTYLLEKNEGYEEWLLALGAPAETSKKMTLSKPKLEVKINATTQVSVTNIATAPPFNNTILLGQESKTKMPTGAELTANISVVGDCLKGTAVIGDKKMDVLFQFSPEGLVTTVNMGPICSKRTYKRV
ncbi:unnamed protein product [Meganyctiphanes norvegica]|uniref:Uncharacterized protein n=1 Tax=Meganyctiphanes norvegica TaxID=48144 RepID=A0AAV2RYZ5_MEGNR